MQPSKKSGSTAYQLCGTALLCLCVLVLLMVLTPEATLNQIPTPASHDELIQITPGSSISGEIAAGAKKVVGVNVGQNQLLRVSLEKGDLMLLVNVYSPAGAELLEQVSQEFETVEISLPADEAGIYRIELQSRETEQASRPYEIRVQSVTPVTAADRKDSEARRMMARAEVSRSEWTEAAFKNAIEEYDHAAAIWNSAARFSNASLAVLRGGDICFVLSRYPEALKRYKDAAVLAKKGNDRLAEGNALSRMGRLRSFLGDNDLAKKLVTSALDLLRPFASDGNPVGRSAFATAFSNSAEVNYAKGNFLKAGAQFEEAGKLFDHDRKGEARVHLFKGYIAGTLGRPKEADTEISQALELYRTTGDKAGEGLALITLGTSKSRTVENSIQYHRQAIDIFHSFGDRLSEAIALNAIGQVNERAKDYEVALNKYESALRLFESVGAMDLATITMVAVGMMHRELGHQEEALAYYNRCLTLSRRAGKVRIEEIVLLEIASVYESQESPEPALQHYRKAQKFYESIDDRPQLVKALNGYGNFLFRLGRKQEALSAYNQALPVSEQSGDKAIQISTLYNLARVNRDLGNHDAALSFIKQSVDSIEQLRAQVGGPDLSVSFLEGVRANYELYINILMQLDQARPGQGFTAAALEVSERSRARALLDLMGESQVDLRKGASPALLERERELNTLIQKMAQYEMSLSPNEKNSTDAAETASQLVDLRAAYHEVQAQLREQSSQRSFLSQFEPASLKQIQGKLQTNDLLLEYSLGEERSYLWAVTPNSIDSYELPARKAIDDAAIEVYKLLTARQRFDEGNDYQKKVEVAERTYPEKAGSLSQMLLGPVAHLLKNRRLILVKEGALQYLPFDALFVPTPGASNSTQQTETYLGQTNESVELPSMSTLVAMRTEADRPASADKVVAVIADPVFSRADERVQSDASPVVAHAAPNEKSSASIQEAVRGLHRGADPDRLMHTSEEADTISAFAPRGTTMVAKGFDANRETAMSSLVGKYQIVHFATHAVMDSEHPELSGIVLSMVNSNGVQQDGLMPLHDIYGLNLSADLVVLSACQTALGKEIRGEGLVGLTHGFISAGSKGVVASLWKVDDQATSMLMSDLYESMLQEGASPATALRSAKLKLMKEQRWRAPYYWAAFVFQGDYDHRIIVKNNSFSFLWLAPLLVLISSGLVVLRRRRRRLSTATRS